MSFRPIRNSSLLTLVILFPGFISAQEYILQPDSEISFKVKHLGVLNVNGRFTEFAGNIHMEEDELMGQGMVLVESVDTDNGKRDSELKGPDFLDAGKFPEIKYQSKRNFNEGATSFLEGDLTIKDQTRTLVFPYDLTRTGQGILIEFDTVIKRSNFDLDFGAMDGLVGEDIQILGYLLFEKGNMH